MYSIKQDRGFAILTSAVLLSIAGIAFTANMASTQLIDNQIVGNYYRNNEAFINAESGINLILSKIDQSSAILVDLPYTPPSVAGSNYSVKIERINKNSVEISSIGTSEDGSAQREIHLQVYHEVSYAIPESALLSNGKLNIDFTATINEGCEGLSAGDCRSPGNLAKYQMISNPAINKTLTATEIDEKDALCMGAAPDENEIDQAALYNEDSADNNFLTIGDQVDVLDKNGNIIVDEFGDKVTEAAGWPNELPFGSEFYGVSVSADSEPSTLFESTFGVTREVGVNALQASSEVITIDMTVTGAISCSEQLTGVDDNTTTIYIKGDCDISQYDASKSITSENMRFTIGTVDNPKLVFIEGGTFITQPNTGASVIGMLYFLPGEHAVTNADKITEMVEDLSVDMGGIRVNGAMLSDYKCSHDGYDNTDPNGTKQHFSARYDKTVLNKLYKNTDSVAIDVGYSIVAGSWRDF